MVVESVVAVAVVTKVLRIHVYVAPSVLVRLSVLPSTEL